MPLRLKQTFPPIIYIFTEGEGDEIESRLPFKIFSTLLRLDQKNYIILHQTFGIKTLEIPIFVGRSVIIIICKILAGKIDGTRWTQIDDMKCDVTFAEWVSMFTRNSPSFSFKTHPWVTCYNQAFISKMHKPSYSC